MGAGVQQTERRGRRRRSRPMAEINVTPFVDVMLVLLIIFMVAAPLLTVGIELDLPESAAPPLPEEDETPLELAITPDAVFLQSQEVALDRLVPQLREVMAERTSPSVYVRADATVSYGRLSAIIGAVEGSGVAKINLVHDSGGPTLDEGEE